MTARLSLVVLAVPDLGAATRFSRAAFGWEQAVTAPSYAELSLPNGLRLGLYERQGFGRNTGQVPHLVPEGALAPTELYFDVEDPGASARALEAAGARCLSPLAPRDWGDDCAYWADPFGTVLVLARRTGAA